MRIAFLVTLLFFSLAVVAAPQYYRWVDKDGNVHYTDTPPPGDDYQKVEGAAPAPNDVPEDGPTTAERIRDWRQRQIEQSEAEQKQRRAQQEARQAEATREQNCRQARENLQYLQEHTQIIVPPKTEGGNARRIPDDERVKMIEQGREAVRKFCGAS